MGVNEPTAGLNNWISASITDQDKAMLAAITRLDSQETGTADNQSATIRRLIRQEARRRKIVISDISDN